jgi:serine/threonine-protein kinase
MAPEQVKGEEVDARADLYGCGAVLYEALTGYPPFFAGNRADLIIEILHGRRRPARSYRPELPVQVDVVLAKAMARDLNARFQDAMAFQRALEKLRHAHVISTAPDIVPSTIGPATAAPVTEPMEETFDDNAIGESIEVVFSSSPETLRERDTAPPSPGASKGEAEEETETKPMPARRGRGRR